MREKKKRTKEGKERYEIQWKREKAAHLHCTLSEPFDASLLGLGQQTW
jgi:hypothetical protein